MYLGQQYVTKIAKSLDQGASWQVYTASNQDITLNALAVDPSNPDIVYAGGYIYDESIYNYKHKILKSTNSGMNWTEKTSGMMDSGIIYALAIDPTAPNNIYAGASDAVYKSVDGADSWNKLGCRGVNSLLIDPNSPTKIYAGTNSGVFISFDAGANWFGINEGLTLTTVTALAIDPVATNKIYAATYGCGVFTLEMPVSVEEKRDDTPLPKTFTLYQNCPNPFNATTQLKYSIPKTSDVSLNIYNMNGELVRVLYYGIEQPGYHTQEWDGKDDAQRIVATGVYLCHLTVNGFTLTRKMLLMK